MLGSMFQDRIDAGHRLASAVAEHGVGVDLVLAIPRGGLPVDRVVADRLAVPLDVVAARKIGAPWNPELALGAVASDGTVWLNDPLIDRTGVEDASLEAQIKRERGAASEVLTRYRGGRPSVRLDGKRVLVVDDGAATGATAMACLKPVASAGASAVILAVPVAPPDVVDRLRGVADSVIAVETPADFGSVGRFYESFPQVSDEEAMASLQRNGD